jgi:addiction module RelE/StbE family toxin
MRVKWLRAALRNLEEISAFISRDDPDAAERVVRKIVHAVYMLADQPAIGRPGRVAGTRELVIPDTPYIVPYRVRGEFVQIIRVIHAARRWPKSF